MSDNKISQPKTVSMKAKKLQNINEDMDAGNIGLSMGNVQAVGKVGHEDTTRAITTPKLIYRVVICGLPSPLSSELGHCDALQKLCVLFCCVLDKHATCDAHRKGNGIVNLHTILVFHHESDPLVHQTAAALFRQERTPSTLGHKLQSSIDLCPMDQIGQSALFSRLCVLFPHWIPLSRMTRNRYSRIL